MKILSLNTQKAYNSALIPFLQQTLDSGIYDFIVLQEAIDLVTAPFIQHSSYTLLRGPKGEEEQKTQLAILYRKSFTVTACARYTFPYLHALRNSHPPAYGFLLGTFLVEGKTLQVGSVHLHSGIHPDERKKELAYVKRYALEKQETGSVMVCGGDFNFGLPGELSHARRFLNPEFSLETYTLGATLSSKYTEPNPNLTNTGAVVLGKLGIELKFKTDHFFTDATTAETQSLTTRILPDRVSDHSPIELSF